MAHKEDETSMDLESGLSRRQKVVGAKWNTRTETQNRAAMRATHKGMRKFQADHKRKWKEIADKLQSKIYKESSRRSRKIGEEKKRESANR